MREELPRGTVTFFFTDVDGSTRLLRELGAETYAEALAEHRRVLREACARDGGVEVDTQGDAFFFAFPTPPGALAAARAATDALAAGRVQVRIGVHTGTPLVTEAGYVGDDVHLAARVGASGHGGQILVSGATAGLVETALLDLGEHRLKDIGEPVAIFQLGDGSFPPLKTISNTNLPRPASSFVGRERELEEVLTRVERGARLVTLTGPGGSGKTRLAIEAAASLVPEYKAGVFWVGLASLRDSALVTETIAQTLGAKDGLAEHVGERELLLLLDNLEHVIEAAPALAALLSACRNLTLLVTSRELLRVQGEVEYPVPPLAEPEAVSLFCERSQLEPTEQIADLCLRLDSLPLAVELAAARTKALSPAQILERVSQRLDLLKGGRDADPRQQTLRATIEWSYHLLSEEEQQLFARLSVFAGGCTLEAAEDVCDAELDTLQSLVEKSLLRFTNERYWMLETIRGFAAEQVRHAGEANDLHRRHVEWFVAVAEEAETLVVQDERGGWRLRLRAEHANIRVALDWGRAADVELALRLAGALRFYWLDRNLLGEGWRWLSALLEAGDDAPAAVRAKALAAAARCASISGDRDAERELNERSLALYREVGDTSGIAWALTGLGHHSIELESYEDARRQLDEALVLHRESADEIGVKRVLHLKGLEAQGRGDIAAGRALLRESVELSRGLGDLLGLGASLHSLGDLELQAGDCGAARSAYGEGLRHAAEIEAARVVCQCLAGLGAVSAAEGDAERACRLWAFVLALEAELDFRIRPAQRAVYERLVQPPAALPRVELEGSALQPAVEYALASLD